MLKTCTASRPYLAHFSLFLIFFFCCLFGKDKYRALLNNICNFLHHFPGKSFQLSENHEISRNSYRGLGPKAFSFWNKWKNSKIITYYNTFCRALLQNIFEFGSLGFNIGFGSWVFSNEYLNVISAEFSTFSFTVS
jgi:hypothetical protein